MGTEGFGATTLTLEITVLMLGNAEEVDAGGQIVHFATRSGDLADCTLPPIVLRMQSTKGRDPENDIGNPKLHDLEDQSVGWESTHQDRKTDLVCNGSGARRVAISQHSPVWNLVEPWYKSIIFR